ncbi:hypothetical protein ACNJKD_13580 [Edwardsiella tarda]
MDNSAVVWDNALAYLAIYAAQEANQRSQQQVPGAPDQADAE